MNDATTISISSSTYNDVVVVMAVCNFPKGDLYSHESILEQKLRQKGVLNDDEYSSQDLDWILICTLAKKRSIFQQRPHYIRTMQCREMIVYYYSRVQNSS